MSTNETNLLEPINYIVMPAIYQHFYEALVLTLLVAHHGDMQRVDGRTVQVEADIFKLLDTRGHFQFSHFHVILCHFSG